MVITKSGSASNLTERWENAPASELLIAQALVKTARSPEHAHDAVDVDDMMEHMWIVGDPQECADRIRRLYEAVGGFGMLLAITQDSDDPEWDQGSLRLLIEEVGPRVADLS